MSAERDDSPATRSTRAHVALASRAIRVLLLALVYVGVFAAIDSALRVAQLETGAVDLNFEYRVF